MGFISFHLMLRIKFHNAKHYFTFCQSKIFHETMSLSGLELLIEGGCWDDRAILEQCVEVKKLLIASVNTARKNGKA